MPARFHFSRFAKASTSHTPALRRAALVLSGVLAAGLGLASSAGLASESGPRAQSPRSAAQATRANAAARVEEARVIVKFKSGSTLVQAQSANTSATTSASASASAARLMPLAQAQALSRRHGLALNDGITIGPRTQVVRGSGMSSAQLAAQLAADPDVEYAEVDRRVRAFAAPNDPLYGTPLAAGAPIATPVVGQWYLRPPAAPAVAAINAEGAWDVTTGSASVVVAVLDTGVRLDHPDLAGKLLPGYDFVHDAAYANDGDGWDGDPSDPGDWITDAEDTSGPFQGCGESDSSWHGTQTAGLVGAATNNGTGMASVGRNVMLLPVRVLGKCGGYDSDVLAGMRWAAGIAVSGAPANPNPARVINLSLGAEGACSQSYSSLIATLNSMGVVVVAAAGNGIDDPANEGGIAVDEPANCPGVIAVAGLRHTGTKVGYSNLGPEVAIAAPAGNCVTPSGQPCLYPIVSTSNTGTQGPAVNTYSDGSVRPSLGTSFSAPLVAGTTALMLATQPTLLPSQVKSLLQSSARAFPASGTGAGVTACQAPTSVAQGECYCTTSTCGAGMLDTRAAVQAVASSMTVARIDAPGATVVPGSDVTLTSAGSRAADGGALGYAWTATTTGTATAAFTSATNASTATVTLGGNGSVTVALTVTDSQQGTSTASRRLSVGTGAVVTTAPPAPPADGGGGGAFDLVWLVLAAGLAAAAARSRVAPRQVRVNPPAQPRRD